MMRYRLIFGTILILGLIGLIYADDRLAHYAAFWRPATGSSLGLSRCDGFLITVVMAAIVVLGTREMHNLLVAAGHHPVPIWPALMNVALVLIPFLAASVSVGEAGVRDAVESVSTGTWLTVAFLGSAFLIARRRTVAGAMGDLAATLLIVLYLGVLSQYILRVRLARPDGGAWLLLYFLATVKVCDMGAFFTGRLIGRRKLIEWLSPKKTVEGLAGGIIASVVAAAVIPMAVRRWAPASAAAVLLPQAWEAALFGLLMALVGQAGDLFESLIKREAHAKDSADAIPAFGGVLDVLDSPLLAAPIAYWLLQV
ncbi:MAG TPA: phosphatidate cytidylyltransferase [Phycisphaerae bacterium]|nr:phosphatidate cytidylyltransferase [Phycisphaerae bacterium]